MIDLERFEEAKWHACRIAGFQHDKVHLGDLDLVVRPTVIG